MEFYLLFSNTNDGYRSYYQYLWNMDTNTYGSVKKYNKKRFLNTFFSDFQIDFMKIKFQTTYIFLFLYEYQKSIYTLVAT